MQAVTISFANMHHHGTLLADILRARHAIFNDRLGWGLPSDSGMEFDQYDTPQSRWVAVTHGNRLMGGLRLTPTTARCGIYSYMIRDAQRGLLEGMPTDLLSDDAPVDPTVWESSRVFVVDGVPSSLRRPVQKLLYEEMARSARSYGALEVVGMLHPLWARWGDWLGMDITALGPILPFDGAPESASQCVTIDIRRWRCSG